MEEGSRTIFCCECGKHFKYEDIKCEDEIVCIYCKAEKMCIDVSHVKLLIDEID